MKVKLVVIGGKQAGLEIPVRGPKFLIGRGEHCQLRPQTNLISRKHCVIVLEDGSVTIEDLGSSNGTIVNGTKISRRQDLKSGDRLKIGPLELEVRLALSLEGKTQPKAQDVKQADAPTVAASTDNDKELDISNWLSEGDEDQDVTALPPKTAAAYDTSMGKNLDDTISLPASSDQKKKENEPAAKVVGQFNRTAKPMAESSRTAARDMLKQFFPKK